MFDRIVWSLFIVLICLSAYAAEVTNVIVAQEGNRVAFTFDLTGEPNEETDIHMAVTIGDKTYTADQLHLQGDLKQVKTGKWKKIYWNFLQDFPRGYDGEFRWRVAAEGGKESKDPTTGMEFVFVKGGCFDMGDTFGDGSNDEKPVHNVCISDFYIGKYEVTQGQWKAIMGNNPSHFSSCGDVCPAESVSWNDVQKFIYKLRSRTGKSFRLPTEAEWEYAARSGGKKEKYAGTSSDSDLGSYAWYVSNSGSKTHPGGQKKPNSLGLYDMTGNAWEWVSDWYVEKYYKSSPRKNPQGPSTGSERVLRGGDWLFNPTNIRASIRFSGSPSDRINADGFRVASSSR